MNEMYIDSNGYTFNGATLTLFGGYAATTNPLNLTSGNATINANIQLLGDYQGSTGTVNVSVASGSTLTVGNVTNSSAGGYGQIAKIGNGVLEITGTLNTVAFGGTTGLNVNAGTVILHGASNVISVFSGTNTNNVLSGATLAGNATLTQVGGVLNIAGNLAPGENTPGSNFGGIGTLSLKGGGNQASCVLPLTSISTSHLDLDIASNGSPTMCSISLPAHTTIMAVIPPPPS